jgi:hypothetical protein
MIASSSIVRLCLMVKIYSFASRCFNPLEIEHSEFSSSVDS